jgi:hypothetical protein
MQNEDEKGEKVKRIEREKEVFFFTGSEMGINRESGRE